MPLAKAPNIADSYFTGGQYVFTLHDVYHGQRDSAVNRNERLALQRIDWLLKDALQKNQNDQTLKDIQWKLVDGELYKSSRNESFGHLFRLPFWTASSIRLVISDMADHRDLWRWQFGITRADLLPPEQEIYDQHRQAMDGVDEQLASSSHSFFPWSLYSRQC
jgi:hypothetical protein